MSYKYIIDHIPTNTPNNRRPRNSMSATTITIHNTGNEKSTARNERNWLTNPTNNRQASYHIAIDEREAIECIPTNENAWHAGDGRGDGNMRSIGIEICESGNYAKTIENTIDLVAKMLHERKWGVDRLKRHFDWSRKICPRLMHDNGTWRTWEQFKQRVQVRLNELKNPQQNTQNQTQFPSANVTFNGKTISAINVNSQVHIWSREIAVLLDIPVDFVNGQVVLDGKFLPREDVKLINGRGYVHVRRIADVLGLNVAWEQSTRTVLLSK